MSEQKELEYAEYVLPFLEQQLKMYSTLHKQLSQENLQVHVLLLDMIGIVELKIAMANAIINRDQYNSEQE